MNIKQQLFIDRYLIRFVIFMINYMVRILGFILRMDHSLDKPFRKIAVCKYKGMGSIIQSMPLLKSLRIKYPDAEIIFVSTLQNQPILQKISIIDTFILLDDSSFMKLILSFPGFITKLISKRIEVYLDLEIYSGFSSLVITLSMATNRLGYYLRSSNYRLGIYTGMMFYNVRLPIHQVYLQMGRLLGIDGNDQSLWKFDDTTEPERNKKLKNYGIQDSRYMVLNPNASDLRIERRWPAQNFVDLVLKLHEKFPGYCILLIGSKGESDYVRKIHSQVSFLNNVYDLSGKTSLNELIILLKQTELFITNDSGPMHLAFSLQTLTISLFGPCLPSQYGAQQKMHAIHKNIYCSPCVHEFITPPCKGNNVCMKLITPDEVLSLANEILDKNNSYEPSTVETAIFYEQLQNKAFPLGIVHR